MAAFSDQSLHPSLSGATVSDTDILVPVARSDKAVPWCLYLATICLSGASSYHLTSVQSTNISPLGHFWKLRQAKMSNSTTSRLLTIAPEIRQAIYKCVFEDNKIECHLQMSRTHWPHLMTVTQSQHHELLLVCSQIHLEADALYQSLTVVKLHGRPWTPLALERHIDACRLGRIRNLTISSANGLLETLGSLPKLKAVRIIGDVWSTWEAAKRGKDLIDDDEVKSGLKEIIEERGEPEWADWHGLGMKGMMGIVDFHPCVKVYGKAMLKVIHFEGDGCSVFNFNVDFSKLEVDIRAGVAWHYHRADGRHDDASDLRVGF